MEGFVTTAPTSPRHSSPSGSIIFAPSLALRTARNGPFQVTDGMEAEMALVKEWKEGRMTVMDRMHWREA